jgi:membrane fusion protein, multidrug efflux system
MRSWKASDMSEHDDLGFDLPPPARPSPVRIVVVAIGVAALVGVAFLAAWLPRRRAAEALVADTGTTETLRVVVAKPKAKASDRAMTLPGSIQALEETTLYPRANGYVRSWKADIGDAVKEGALLAEIDTPDTEQQLAQGQAQLAQAEAALAQAKANRSFAETNLQRYQALTPKGAASEQELDKARSQFAVDSANVEVATANIEAQKANLRRLAQLQGFSRIVAPFAGTITSRTVERGALVSPSTPLFKVSHTDTVRVLVQIPQDVAPSVRVDAKALVTVREFAGRAFEGKVARSAGALDPASRTMTTEVRIPNPSRELLAGMYAQVAITMPMPHRVLEVPASAVMADARGVHVGVVEGGKIRLAAVVVERDNGATIDIATGLDEQDTIVKLGSADILDGRPVTVVP